MLARLGLLVDTGADAVLKPHPRLRQRVEVRRLDRGIAVAPQLHAEIVGDDQNNVLWLGLLLSVDHGRRQPQAQQKHHEERFSHR